MRGARLGLSGGKSAGRAKMGRRSEVISRGGAPDDVARTNERNGRGAIAGSRHEQKNRSSSVAIPERAEK
jgi:hypothetical protein